MWMRATKNGFAVAVTLALAVHLVACSGPPDPPDMDRVIGHSPEEVRDYLGKPKESDNKSDMFALEMSGKPILLSVVYRNRKAAWALSTIRPPEHSVEAVREWLGTNCAVTIESDCDTLPGFCEENGLDATTAASRATIKGPCLPRR